MNSIKMNVWGKTLSLKILYDTYADESNLPMQEEALDLFIKEESVIEKSLGAIKKYILSNNEDIKSVENIYKYVKPNTLYVIRDSKIRKIIVLCNYSLDLEHGLAIAYRNEKLVDVGITDDVICRINQ